MMRHYDAIGLLCPAMGGSAKPAIRPEPVS
jgi:hypothetical protein